MFHDKVQVLSLGKSVTIEFPDQYFLWYKWYSLFMKTIAILMTWIIINWRIINIQLILFIDWFVSLIFVTQLYADI